MISIIIIRIKCGKKAGIEEEAMNNGDSVIR